ncbi:MAG: hypothetical protein B7Z66_09095 [Chromatiales bacterium 21-64-14]|nr:MAG: hypothetical protein B7Z66_09095 [Chromatiales bacterium 21-64-14]
MARLILQAIVWLADFLNGRASRALGGQVGRAVCSTSGISAGFGGVVRFLARGVGPAARQSVAGSLILWLYGPWRVPITIPGGGYWTLLQGYLRDSFVIV